MEPSLAVYIDCFPGRKTYTNQKKILYAAGHKSSPAWMHLHGKQDSVTPKLSLLPDPFIGV